MATKNGQSIMFKESDVRAMGRAAAGVRGMRLADKDELVGTDAVTASGKDQFFLNMGKQRLRQEDKRKKLSHSKKRRFGHQDFQSDGQDRSADGGQNYRPWRRGTHRHIAERPSHQSVFVRDTVFRPADSRSENNENESRRQHRLNNMLVKS